MATETRTGRPTENPGDSVLSMTRDFSFDIIRLRRSDLLRASEWTPFEVDCKKDGEWTTVAKATSIGQLPHEFICGACRTAEVRASNH